MDRVALPPAAAHLLRVVLALGGIAAATSLAAVALGAPFSPYDAAGGAVLVLTIAAALRLGVTVTVRGNLTTVSLEEAAIAIALLSVSTPWVVLAVGGAYLIDQVLARRPAVKAAWNVAAALVNAAAAVVVLLLLAPRVPAWLAATAAATAYAATSSLLLTALLARMEGRPLRLALREAASVEPYAVAVSGLLAVVALGLYALHPVAALVLLPAALAARGDARLRERAERDHLVRERLARLGEELSRAPDVATAADLVADACHSIVAAGETVVELDAPTGSVVARRGDAVSARGPPIEHPLPSTDGPPLGRIVVRAAPRTIEPLRPEDGSLLALVATSAAASLRNVVALAEAREANARFETWLAAAHDAVLVVDRAARIRYANPAARRILGAEPGLALEAIFPAPPPRATADEVAGRHHPTGRELRLDASANELPDGSGLLVVARDVSERANARAAEAALARSERMALAGSLASGLGHEINNMLTVAVMNVDLLAIEVAESGLEPAAKENVVVRLGEVGEALDRVSVIARNLRQSARRNVGVVHALDVNRIVADAVALASPRLRRLRRVSQDLRATSPVAATKVELGQVVLNLLLNAADVLGEDGEVRVRSFEESSAVVVEVEDTGPGIPADVAARIFEPYFTTKPEGTGIGLTLSRSIVEAAGGNLTFRSVPGSGTTFRIELPAAPR